MSDTPRTIISELSRAGQSGKRSSQQKKRQERNALASASQTAASKRSLGSAAAAQDEITPRTMIQQLSRLGSRGRSVKAKPASVASRATAIEDMTPRSLLSRVTSHEKKLIPGLVRVIATPVAADGTPVASMVSTPQSFLRSDYPSSISSLHDSIMSARSAPASTQRQTVVPRLGENRAGEVVSMPPPAKKQTGLRKRQRTPAAKASLPPALVGSLFASFSSATVSADAKAAVQEGVEEFFDQMVKDVSSYAEHASRATIEKADVTLLMDRQRLTLGPNAPSALDLARKFLPMEVLEQLIPVATGNNDVYPPPKQRRVRAKRNIPQNDAVSTEPVSAKDARPSKSIYG